MRRNKWQLRFIVLAGLISGISGIPSVCAEDINITTQAEYTKFIGDSNDGNIIADQDASNGQVQICV